MSHTLFQINRFNLIAALLVSFVASHGLRAVAEDDPNEIRRQAQEGIYEGFSYAKGDTFDVQLKLSSSVCSNGVPSKAMRGIRSYKVNLFKSGTYRVQAQLKSKRHCMIDEIGQYYKATGSTRITFQPTNKVYRCAGKPAQTLSLGTLGNADLDRGIEEYTFAFTNDTNSSYCPNGEFLINHFLVQYQ